MEQRKFRMPTAYTILFCLILLVALSTWLIPAGSYDYADGIPISGSYHAVAPAPQGIGAALKAAFRGFYDAVDVCVFILMVGGFLGVVMKTGAIDAGVSNVISRLQGRENLLITILMLFFGLGGTTYGMWEETMAFFPLLLPIFLAAGYDAVVGVAVILLGAGAGVIASTVNPFATGIAAGFAGVSLGEGLLWRLIQFVIFEGAAIWYVSAYAARIKRDPSRSVVGIGAGRLHADVGRVQPLTRRHAAILLIFAATFLTMIYGVIPFDEMGLPLPVLGWWFPELSALFLVAGIVVGLMDRLSEVELAETFVSGCTDLLGVAFIIGISRGITVLMNDGHITDTILHWGETALSGLGSTSFVLLVFLIYLPLSVLIPSSSGLATLSVPVVAPLGQFAGVGGDVVVTAFQSACGLVNLVTPTAAVVMGALALGRIPYEKWLKFVWKLMLLFLLLTGLLLVLAAALSGSDRRALRGAAVFSHSTVRRRIDMETDKHRRRRYEEMFFCLGPAAGLAAHRLRQRTETRRSPFRTGCGLKRIGTPVGDRRTEHPCVGIPLLAGTGLPPDGGTLRSRRRTSGLDRSAL